MNFRGGLIVTRVFHYHPSIVQAIFSCGTPYLPPEPEWLEFDDYIKKYPTFKYQKHFGGKELEFDTEEQIRLFFIAGYYGKGPNGEMPFSTERALIENWPLLIKSDVLSDEVGILLRNFELEYCALIADIGAGLLHPRIYAPWNESSS